MVARWKPVHKGHQAVLEGLLGAADHVVIGLGSSNIYDARSPFTAAESAEMIEAVIGPPGTRYSLVEIPDLFDGPRWQAMVVEKMGALDLFVTANRYVRDLLSGDYTVLHPVHFVAPEARVAINGKMVRQAAARGEDWERLVPEAVAEYLKKNRLIERMVQEFGETIRLGAEAREPGPA
jgi:nicotinamide mononucleotide adenylyltransferase